MRRLLRSTVLLLGLALACSCRDTVVRADYKTAYSLPPDWAERCGVDTDTEAARYTYMAVTTDWIKDQVRKNAKR